MCGKSSNREPSIQGKILLKLTFQLLRGNVIGKAASTNQIANASALV